MNYLPVYLLESTVCLGVFYLFYMMVLHDQPCHRYNRFYLLSTSLLSLVLPLLEIPLLTTGGLQQVAGNYQNYILLDPAILAGSSDASGSSSTTWSWFKTILLLYGSGITISLAFFLREILRLVRVLRNSRAVNRKNYRLVYTEGQWPTSSLFSYLFWDNTQTLTSREAAQIIAHEEAHIQEEHSYDIFYLAIFKMLFWFHPLVYLRARAGGCPRV